MSSHYFTDHEMACKCKKCAGKNLGPGIPSRLWILLDRIRETIGKPIIVLSGYRCPAHNKEVGGKPQSLHMSGKAADITYDGIDVDHLANVAEACGADGIGRYWSQKFVHVDVRGYKARWNENNA